MEWKKRKTEREREKKTEREIEREWERDRQRNRYEVMHLRGVTHLVSDTTEPDLEAPMPPLGIQSEKEGEREKDGN